ncbi:DUF4279 domain-containing protein [bacterium]|nr:MAG: DUF4279 domain-containing protein [bacterium]
MSDEEVIQVVINEFKEKLLGVTEQYLEIHEPIYENGTLKINRIDRENSDSIVVYLPVKNEYFSFAVYIDKSQKEVYNVGTESRNTVSLRATSESLTSSQLQSYTKLKASKSWNKGDLKFNKKSTYKFSCIEYYPNPEPDEFEDKLNKLLTYLETDKSGLLALTTHSHTYIDVTMDFHSGNGLLGNAYINLQNIKRMNELNLQINFDFAAWGNPFK